MNAWGFSAFELLWIKLLWTLLYSKIPLWAPLFNYFGYKPRSRIGRPYSSSVFSFLRNHQNVFQMTTPFYIPTSSTLGFQLLPFFAYSILMGMMWYLIIVLTCFSLMTHDVEHHFMCLLTILISSLTCAFYIFLSHLAHLTWCSLYLCILSRLRKWKQSFVFEIHSIHQRAWHLMGS